MIISKNTVVTLDYQMFDETGALLDETSDTPMTYLHGGYDGIFPLVEEGLHGKTVGDAVEFLLEADDAFGPREEDLVREEALDVFPEEVKVGMMFETDDPMTGEIMLFTVTRIDGDEVTVDGNHPLAGKTIRFCATVKEVRAASSEELEHGHVHGEHGHHH